MFRKPTVSLLIAALLIACLAPAAAAPATNTAAADSGAEAFTGATSRDAGTAAYVVAPENADYAKYREEKLKGQAKTMTSDGKGLGYTPSPVSLSHLKGKQVSRRALVAAARGLAAEGGLEESIPGGDIVSFSASYDLRTLGKLTPVKNQGSCGSCWAFATYGSLESTLKPDETWDFSENNLKNKHGYAGTHCAGGNAGMSTAYLARYAGPVSESDDPYNAVSSYSPANLAARKHVQDVLYLPDRSGPLDNDNIKNAIQVYGGIYSLVYWTDGAYSSAYKSFYYSGTSYANHAITIVGWDDNYERSRFRTSPSGNGAFIVRNSWGTSWGDSGYFYVSYYDSVIGKGNAVFTGESTLNFQHIYQYDTLGWLGNAGYGTDTAYFGNVFTATAAEEISAVSFYTASTSSEYQISVYTNPTGGPVNTAGPLSVKTGTIAIPGYHTVRLDTPVSVTSGQKFSAVVRLRTPGYNYPVPLESPVTGFATNVNAAAGQSYISANGNSWSDVTASWKNTNVCLKAFGGAGSPNPAPVLTGISPATGTAGGAAFPLTATGSSFTSESIVRWNGADRTTTFVSASQLTASIPAPDITAAGTASVTVYTPSPGGGTSAARTFTITTASNPLPVLTGIFPASAMAGGAAFPLTASGSSFTSQSIVRWNGADRTTTFVSAGQLTTSIPASYITAAGTASVTVYTPSPGGGTSAARIFTITSEAPSGGLVVTAETATTYTYLAYSNTYLKQGQSVTAAGTGISQVAVALAKKGTTPKDITLSVRSSLKGADLATATITSGMVTSTDFLNPTWVTVPITMGGLTSGGTYYIVLTTTGSDLRNYYRVPLNGQNLYKNGNHYKGTSLSSNSAYDMLVKVWFTG
jgi:C1A family cysteine protease